MSRDKPKIEQLREFDITPGINQDGLTPVFNASTNKFDWIKISGTAIGEKKTNINSGIQGDLSITDDYLYVCVFSGIATVAIWKKVALNET